MAASNVKMPDLIIPVGQSVSNIMNSPLSFDDAEAIAIYAPAALDAGTYILQVCDDPEAVAGSTWVTLQIGDPAGDAAPPAAGKGRVYYELACVGSYRISGPAAVGVDRVFKQTKSIYL